MEAFGLLMHGFAVLLTWKTLLLMMVGLVLMIWAAIHAFYVIVFVLSLPFLAVLIWSVMSPSRLRNHTPLARSAH